MRVGAVTTVRATDAVSEIAPLVPLIVIVEFPIATVDETLNVTATVVPGFALAGEKLSVTPPADLAVRLTISLDPPVPAIAIVREVDLPCAKLTEFIDGVMVKVGAAVTAKATVAV